MCGVLALDKAQALCQKTCGTCVACADLPATVPAVPATAPAVPAAAAPVATGAGEGEGEGAADADAFVPPATVPGEEPSAASREAYPACTGSDCQHSLDDGHGEPYPNPNPKPQP